MTGREIVREVICILKGGEQWAKGAYMRTAEGRHLEAHNPQTPEAAKFCLLGAAHRVLGLNEFHRAGKHEGLREFSCLIRDALAKDKRESAKASGSIAREYDVNTGQYVDDPGDYVVYFNDTQAQSFDDIERVLARALVKKPRKPRKTKTATV